MMSRFILLLAFALLFFGCGDDENNDPGTTIQPTTNNNSTNNETNNSTGTNNNSTGGTNNTTSGTGGFGEDCSDVVCEDGRRCVRGICVLNSVKVSCEDTIELGVLDVSAGTAQASGSTEGFVDAISTECEADEDALSGPENAIKFQVSAPARVTANLTSAAAVDWVMEVRAGSCSDATAALVCTDPETISFAAEVGIDYFLIVEPLQGIDVGAFDIAFELNEQLCAPVGGFRCDGDSVVQCIQGGAAERSFDCAGSCTGQSCDGDACSNPIEVTASTAFMGDTTAHTNTLNFESQPTCSEGGQNGLETPGSEVVLSLPNLTAGQVVTIDASMNDQSDNAIFITAGCSDQEACLAAADLMDILTWTVPADGSYFAVIDKLSTSQHTFNYTVDIQ